MLSHYCYSCGYEFQGSTEQSSVKSEEKRKLIEDIQKHESYILAQRRIAVAQSLMPMPQQKLQGKLKLFGYDYEQYKKGNISKGSLIGRNILRNIPFVGAVSDMAEGTSTLLDVSELTSEKLQNMDIEQLRKVKKQL